MILTFRPRVALSVVSKLIKTTVEENSDEWRHTRGATIDGYLLQGVAFL